jgi:hypothetical protein
MEKFRIEPGSAARIAESGPRPASKSIAPGSAAKAAEEQARNVEERAQGAYRGSIGVTLRVATGKRFEFPDCPQGPGEALPLIAAEEPTQVELSAPQPTSSSDASSQEVTSKGSGIFRWLFRR